MSYLIVPGPVSSASATVWVGAIDEGARPQLYANGTAVPLPGWRQLAGGPHQLLYTRAVLIGLAPRARHELTLRVGDKVVATGRLTTLPTQLPPATERPFTVMLGSCFHAANDPSGAAGRTFLNGPRADIKILCGDQVYLDQPAGYFLVHRPDRAAMEALFFETYRKTWEQADPGTGFRQILQEGANYFTADDHELWNNAPNAAAHLRATWSEKGRQDWVEAAGALLDAFQTERAVEQLRVGPVSFFVADTRRHRGAGREAFMADDDMTELFQWVAGLEGPGVLVVGQPIFDKERSPLGARFIDAGLPDFDQYRALVGALSSARHSIVVLTGDVHYGRVAWCQLPGVSSGPAPKLIELIASPLSLVSRVAGGRWSPPPDQFPAVAIPGIPRVPVARVGTLESWENQFLTVELSDAGGGGVSLNVHYWPVAKGGQPVTSRRVYTDTIY
jgi:hypothetical protein